MGGDAPRPSRTNAFLALGLAAAVFTFTRVRAKLDWYVAFHR